MKIIEEKRTLLISKQDIIHIEIIIQHAILYIYIYIYEDEIMRDYLFSIRHG